VLLAGVASAECMVEVAQPMVVPGDLSIQVTLQGKPLPGAKVDLYQDAALPNSLLTDSQGLAMLRRLAPGDYNVVATVNEIASTSLFIRVTSGPGSKTLTMDLTAALTQSMSSVPKDVAIGPKVQAFRGTVFDPSGAFVPSTRIVVVERAEPETAVLRATSDANGKFSDELAEGSYVAFFMMQGFRTAIVAFEVAKSASPAVPLQVRLQIAPSC
jgi:hypothetical protein